MEFIIGCMLAVGLADFILFVFEYREGVRV